MLGSSLRSAAVTAATVIVSCLVFTPQLGLIALMGALMPYWENGRPLWARVRGSALVTAALTSSMAIGVLVAPYSWAIVPASVLVIVVVSALYYTFVLTPGPSPVMLFYAAVLGTFFGADQHVGWRMVAVTAFAAGLASVLLILPLLFNPHGPGQRAVEAARKAVDLYHQAVVGSAEQRLARNAAYQVVNTAWLTLESAWPARGPSHEKLAADLAQITHSLDNTVASGSHLDSVGHPISPQVSRSPTRPSWRFLVSHAMRFDSVAWFTTWRMGLAAGIAGYLGHAVGIGHPYWAILTATIVINQWRDRVATTRRALNRAVGTLLGVVLVWAVSALNLSPWWTVAAVLVFMVGHYLAIPGNYAVALIFITPMALLPVQASGGGGSVANLTYDRVLDTVVGAVTAVAVTWATSLFFPRRLVSSQSARSMATIEAIERHAQGGDQPALGCVPSHAELHYELIHYQSILERAVADDPRLADLVEKENRVADRGYIALARASTPAPSDRPAKGCADVLGDQQGILLPGKHPE
ncbi:FUSC family protein [Nocardia sp. NPDC058518]|uniref:FUSC family protein n=1 Tax=Nocardia sp. NPDC058518 TaxID=3346534 RepID=UPI0036630F8B